MSDNVGDRDADMNQTAGPLCIKWREDVEDGWVICFFAPTEEDDPTENWMPVVLVPTGIFQADQEFYEDLVTATDEWMKRVYEKAGHGEIGTARFPGGLPSMGGAS